MEFGAGECEGDCMENGVRVFLVGHWKLLVVGAACVRSMHPVTFLNRHVAAVWCCAGGTSELEAIAPKIY